MQKPLEWVIAVKLEKCYTKEEIINLYFNHFDFLHNAVGIRLAANTYFAKDPKNLTIGECATLVGMLKNPSYFNPKSHLQRCEERRNVVLGQMVTFLPRFMAMSKATFAMRLISISEYFSMSQATVPSSGVPASVPLSPK